MNVFENCPVFQNTTAGDKLSYSARVSGSELGTHCQYGFGLCREIECLLRLMVIKPVHAIAVIE